ncbi:UNVERIFIED_CONTAM: hypothetical protein Slati_0449600 [Sesamum latifolium]|uniref:Secreted protein n=1 Tax=Sesamum latifolium TaxID=2727402 RepID=A0AAW2XVT2_9LAMI
MPMFVKTLGLHALAYFFVQLRLASLPPCACPQSRILPTHPSMARRTLALPHYGLHMRPQRPSHVQNSFGASSGHIFIVAFFCASPE